MLETLMVYDDCHKAHNVSWFMVLSWFMLLSHKWFIIHGWFWSIIETRVTRLLDAIPHFRSLRFDHWQGGVCIISGILGLISQQQTWDFYRFLRHPAVPSQCMVQSRPTVKDWISYQFGGSSCLDKQSCQLRGWQFWHCHNLTTLSRKINFTWHQSATYHSRQIMNQCRLLLMDLIITHLSAPSKQRIILTKQLIIQQLDW